MNKSAEFNIQGMLIAVLTIGLFFSLVGSWVYLNTANYDTSTYTESSISNYYVMDNITTAISNARGEIEDVTIDRGVFDFFADIFNRIISPFKTIYRSVTTIFSLGNSLVNDLNLLPSIADFITTLISILVFIGIVLIKYYFNKPK